MTGRQPGHLSQRRGRAQRGRHAGIGRAIGVALCLLMAAGCSTRPTTPQSQTVDIREAYFAEAERALPFYLDCNGVNDSVCTCRREGLEQEFASPSPRWVDEGYAALIAYRDDPAHRGIPLRFAETHAVTVMLTSIAADVEDVCSYYDEGTQ